MKSVVRKYYDENKKICHSVYAMKRIHKPTLRRERAVKYQKGGGMIYTNNLEKVKAYFSDLFIGLF